MGKLQFTQALTQGNADCFPFSSVWRAEDIQGLKEGLSLLWMQPAVSCKWTHVLVWWKAAFGEIFSSPVLNRNEQKIFFAWKAGESQAGTQMCVAFRRE